MEVGNTGRIAGSMGGIVETPEEIKKKQEQFNKDVQEALRTIFKGGIKGTKDEYVRQTESSDDAAKTNKPESIIKQLGKILTQKPPIFTKK